MKYLNYSRQRSFLVLLAMFLAFFLSGAEEVKADKVIESGIEAIRSYDVTIQMNRNGTLTVNEIIDYEFVNPYKRGIYRDIPLRSRKDGVDVYKSYVKMNSIKRNGNDEPYTRNSFHEGVRYRVGSADIYVGTGINRYEFNYDIYNAVFEKDGINQVYLNAIGQFWAVPIEKVKVTVKFPDGQAIGKEEIEKLEVYTGSFGVSENNYEIRQDSNIIEIVSKEPFPPYNGLTFMLNLKTDKISPSFLDKMKVVYYAEPLLIISPILVLMLLVYAYMTWFMFGRDPARKAIIPEFNIPKDISPMYAAYIDGTREAKDLLTTGTFSLLSKDYITAHDKKGDGKNVRYTLSEKNDRELPLEEAKVYNALSRQDGNIFNNGEKLYNAAGDIIAILEDRYSSKVYKSNRGFVIPFIVAIIIVFIMALNSNSIDLGDIIEVMFFPIFIVIMFGSIILSLLKAVLRNSSVMIWIFVGIVPLLLSMLLGTVPFITVAIILAMAFLYSRLIGKYTNGGLRQKEYLDGMKMYIKTAEANQIQKFNDVDELVAFFRGILPYAVALGVKNHAIKLMENTIKLYNFDEGTYSFINSRVHYNSYNSYFMSSSISREYNKVYDKMMDEKFSTLKGSGGSGGGFGGGGFSSGGGFSGGGSGGGGGGSW